MDTIDVGDGITMLSFPVGQAYLLRLPDGFALIDTGPAGAHGEILAALAAAGGAPRDLREIVLTHAHKDHTGGAAALAAATGAQVAAGAADADAVRGGPLDPPVVQGRERELYEQTSRAVPEAPPAPVHRELAEGDRLDWGIGARVLHLPGHTPGSVAVHLPGRGAVFTGDTVAFWQDRPIPGVFHIDPAGAVAGYARIAALDVESAFFGHGAPLVGAAGATLRAHAAS